MPAESWGGYDQVFEKAKNVYTWPDLKSNERYGYIAHNKFDLGVVDIDAYKDNAPSIDDLTIYDVGGDGPLVIRSPSGGYHVPFLTAIPSNMRAHSTVEGIDIKGEIARGHVVLPKHNSNYEISNAGVVPVFDVDTATRVVMFGGDPVYTLVEQNQDYDHDGTDWGLSLFPYLDKFGQFPENERVSHPLHGSDTGSNFMVDEGGETWRCWRHEATGNLIHLMGIEREHWDCGGWITMDSDEKANIFSDLYEIAKRKGYIDEPLNYNLSEVRV